jgi:hypothetical protein
MKGRRYFDPCAEVRCWLDADPGPSADYSAVTGAGWDRARVMRAVQDHAKTLRERADLAERWLFIMRYGPAPQGGKR